ncbi:MAG: hypothetical protein ACKOPG_01725 [Novosphingobium sp.]
MFQARLAGFGITLALLLTGAAEAGVIKTKTKSNQSNDRCAGTCPVQHSDAAAALEAAFDRLDLNKDGQLDGAEQAALAASSPGPAETARGAPLKGVDIKIGREAARSLHLTFSATLDQDGDGKVSRAEWLADGLARFDLADSDHDGVLSEAEAAKFGWNIKSSETR